MLNFDVTISGGPEISAKLTALGSGLYKLDGAMDQIGQYLGNYYQNEAFNSRGSVWGTRWQDLNDRYKVAKAQKYAGKPMLVRTGYMRDHGFYFDAGSQSVFVGNRAPYFKYHQEGTSRMPRRQIMGINQANKNKIKTLLANEIRTKLGIA